MGFNSGFKGLMYLKVKQMSYLILMQDSFLRYMAVYLLVSDHTKHFKSVYGKL